MWHASGLRESLHDMSAYGIHVDESAVQFDFAKLKENRDTYVNRQPLIAHCIAPLLLMFCFHSSFCTMNSRFVKRLNSIYSKNLDQSGVDVYNGHGRLLDGTTVQVDGIDGATQLEVRTAGGRHTQQHLLQHALTVAG